MPTVQINGHRYEIGAAHDGPGAEYHVTQIDCNPETGERLHKLYTFRTDQGLVEVRTRVAPNPARALPEPGSPPQIDFYELGPESVETRPLTEFLVPENPQPEQESVINLWGRDLDEALHRKLGAKMGRPNDLLSMKGKPRKSANLELRSADFETAAKNESVRAFLANTYKVNGIRKTEISRLNSGTRVYVRLDNQIHSATVVCKTKNGLYLVCVDNALSSPKYASQRKEHTEACGGLGRAAMAHAGQVVGFLYDYLPGDRVYQDLPWHLGVVPREPGRLASVGQVPVGVIGRPVALQRNHETDEEMVTVGVVNWSNQRLWNYTTSEGFGLSSCCDAMPSELTWCRLALPGSFPSGVSYYERFLSLAKAAVRNPWPEFHYDGSATQAISYKGGDYLVYCGEKPMALPPPRKSAKPYVISRGTVLKYVGPCRNEGPNWVRVSLPEGLVGDASGLVGYELSLKSREVCLLTETYFLPGTPVEVTANVVFRKRSLQGWQGKVVLSTDEEGDVGVEFEEDFGAGSLDGLGKQGKCLYIPAGALKTLK